MSIKGVRLDRKGKDKGKDRGLLHPEVGELRGNREAEAD